ncbi:MAG TPA: DUF1579 family protein [Thermoanaerobaculia bacterium]|jgi:hypothetical protein|nr:DUF1579 family protein [Thermoanaerobaculia bacterium]
MKIRIALAAAALFAGRILVAAPEPAATPPSPEVQKLSYFVGEWTSESDIHPGPMGSGGKATGTSKCRWLDGNYFVSCQDESSTPMGRMSGLGVLGYDKAKRVYTWSGFNNMGQAQVATGTVSGNTWTFASQDDVGGKTMKTRYTLVETSPTAYTFKFEASTDGMTWTPVIDGTVTKK